MTKLEGLDIFQVFHGPKKRTTFISFAEWPISTHLPGG
jgi:hypothetical protein